MLLVGTAVKSAYITQHGNRKAVKSVMNYAEQKTQKGILFLHFVLFCFVFRLSCTVLCWQATRVSSKVCVQIYLGLPSL